MKTFAATVLVTWLGLNSTVAQAAAIVKIVSVKCESGINLNQVNGATYSIGNELIVSSTQEEEAIQVLGGLDYKFSMKATDQSDQLPCPVEDNLMITATKKSNYFPPQLTTELKFLADLEKNRDDYTSAEIKKHIAVLEKIIKTKQFNDHVVLAHIYLVHSGLSGILASKTWSMTQGKLSFKSLKTALSLAPRDKVIVTSHAKAIIEMRSQSEFSRNMMRTRMGIDLRKERALSIQHLEALKVTDETSKEVNSLLQALR